MRVSAAATATALLASIATVSAGTPATIIRKCTVPNTICLTFDDGPTEGTPALLDYLKKKDIKATFFVNADNWMADANNQPIPAVGEYMKMIVDGGHQIGSHTWDHGMLTKDCNAGGKDDSSPDQVNAEITKLDNYVFNATGKRMAYIRTPYGCGTNPGAVDQTLLQQIGDLGYTKVIYWGVDTEDAEVYGTPSAADKAAAGQKALESAKSHLQSDVSASDNSTIVLAHSFIPTADQIIDAVMDFAKEKNFKFVTVAECLNDPSGGYRDGTGGNSTTSTSSTSTSSTVAATGVDFIGSTQDDQSSLNSTASTSLKSSATAKSVMSASAVFAGISSALFAYLL